jgi:signal transduction histidine kinase
MQAVAVGSVLLMSAIVIALAGALVPDPSDAPTLLARFLALAAAVSYFVGFAPPTLLRRTWQQPELRAFLERASSLPRLPDTGAALRALEEGSASALGASHASIGMWDTESGNLRYLRADGSIRETEADEFIGGRSFTSQRPIFSSDATRDDPTHAETYRRMGANAVLAAPITAGENRLGVLCVYAPRAPLFAEDDLHLLRLLADQAAVVLESRTLIDEAAGVRAREEATRLKDDFLSAAAHDLRTPLTILLGQAELLERRAGRDPSAPVDLARVERIAREARRLRTLVQDLLDASRVEEGRLVANVESVDLVAIGTDVCARHATEHGDCLLEAEGPLRGHFDHTRIVQMLDNLIENGRKYSRAGASVHVRIWREGDEARISVRDEGIGIGAADLPHIFDRFYRGANVDDRTYAGMGLGLFICRGIAEQHGGRIWAESAPHRGSTFHVALPVLPATAETDLKADELPAGQAPQTDATPAAGGGQREHPYAHG